MPWLDNQKAKSVFRYAEVHLKIQATEVENKTETVQQ